MGREIRVDALGARVRERVAAKAASGGRASASRDAARPPVGPPPWRPHPEIRPSPLAPLQRTPPRPGPSPPTSVQVPFGVYTTPVCVLIPLQVVAPLPMFFSPSTHVRDPTLAF